MKEPISAYARLGLVHHMLYPDTLRDAGRHVDTLAAMASRPEIETLDCCVPYGDAQRERAVRALNACGKEKVYALHLFPIRKVSLATTCAQEQSWIKRMVSDQIRQAAAMGATGFIFASGADVPEFERPAAHAAFRTFCRWFCGELKPHGIMALLEPFDRTIDKKFLYGPTEDCVALIDSLQPDVGNLALELDMAHVPLMQECFAHAIRTAAPHLKRVHLGNCVLRDTAHPWYGDQHPPIGFPGGEIDVPELTEILGLLLDTGYLSREHRGALVLEIQPFPDKSIEATITDNWARIHRAWAEL